MRVKAQHLAGASIALVCLAFTACNERQGPPKESLSNREQAHVRHVELEGQPNFRDIGGMRRQTAER